jgi:integrase
VLTDAKIKAAKPRATAYKLADSGQLFLHVTPAGGKHWRMNYTFGKNAQGKPAQKTLTFGPYGNPPGLTLVEARRRRDEAKVLLRDGKDPAVERRVASKVRAAESENTFKLVARRWFALRSGWDLAKLDEKRRADGTWSLTDAAHWATGNGIWSIVHASDVLRSLERDVFEEIGDLPITAIESPKVLEVLNAIAQRGAIETAHRVCQRISDVYVYAVPAGLAKANPAASMSKALPKVPRSKKQPSIIDGIRDHDAQIAAVRTMLKACDDERCRASTKFALRLLALTAVRPNEIQNARWSEIEDLDGPEPLWRIPAERMKGDQDRKAEEMGEHLVPLSPQAVAIIRALRPLTGGYQLMFPSERHVHRPISENTLRALLIRAGYYQRHVPHGFRAAFSTIMNERPKGPDGRHDDDRAVIDLMLAHVPKDKVEGAYNRAAYMSRRRELAQAWADLVCVDLCAPQDHIGKPIRWADTTPKGPRVREAA